MNHKLTNKEIITIGLMLFALFFGAGNMIFPPFLGQQAGTNVWIAILGFLITGVGLPLMGVIAIARVGDLQTLASRVHPRFGIVFTVVMYLAIGPFFGIPRTGTVAYEIGITPFLSTETASHWTSLFMYTVIFFSVTAVLALNPSKLVDRIGKWLTPALLLVLAMLVIKSYISPMGAAGQPTKEYVSGPFFKGFIDGYLTMDTIAALVFGIVVISSIKERGIKNNSLITKTTVKAGVIAATCLSAVYLSLAYIGATGVESIGIKKNGGGILSAAANELFGSYGAIVLGLAITFACITTSVGLVSSCAQYFAKLNPKISYKMLVWILSLFSMVVANIGLTQLIKVSVPILIMIYPLAIVLIILSFMHQLFHGYSSVYIGALIPTGLISLVDGLKATGLQMTGVVDFLSSLPLFSQGIGWILPAIIGAIIGLGIARVVGEAKKTIETEML